MGYPIRRGPGPHPRAEETSEPVTVRLSPAERDVVERAARANRQSRSQFIRDVVMDAAEECFEKDP